MTPEERNMRVPHVCTLGCQIAPTDHWPKDTVEPTQMQKELMTFERLATALERIASALDRIYPPIQWTWNPQPWNPVPYTLPPVVSMSAMTQADGQGDDSGRRGD